MIYLVYRTPHVTPLARKVLTFEDSNLMDWIRRIWPPSFPKEGQAFDWENHYNSHFVPLGLENICGMGGLWEDMLDHGPPPETKDGLKEWFQGRWYSEGQIEVSDHAFQSHCDNDDYDFAVMIFDETFRSQNRDRVDFLLRQEWELPESIPDQISDELMFQWEGVPNDLPPTGNGFGETFAALIVLDDGGWLTDLLGPFRFTRTRLPGFPSFLRSVEDEVIEESNQLGYYAPNKWRPELISLRKFALESKSNDFAKLLDAYDAFDKTQFDKKYTPTNVWSYKRNESIIQSTPHMAQIAFQKTSTSTFSGSEESTWSWIFFDDVWASANPDLAKSILWAAKSNTPLI